MRSSPISLISRAIDAVSRSAELQEVGRFLVAEVLAGHRGPGDDGEQRPRRFVGVPEELLDALVVPLDARTLGRRGA